MKKLERNMKNIDNHFGQNKINPTVLCDFDDTSAIQNVADLVLTKSPKGVRKELKKDYRSGLIGLREYQEQSFFESEITEQQIHSIVSRDAILRGGFVELWQYCKTQSVPMAIVTHGLHTYVTPLLSKFGLENVPIYGVETQFFDRGIDFFYKYSSDTCFAWGNCKCLVLEKYRTISNYIIYVGDGKSDFCPAKKADLVFAKDALYEHLKNEGISCIPFDNFEIVKTTLMKLLGEVEKVQ